MRGAIWDPPSLVGLLDRALTNKEISSDPYFTDYIIDMQ